MGGPFFFLFSHGGAGANHGLIIGVEMQFLDCYISFELGIDLRISVPCGAFS